MKPASYFVAMGLSTAAFAAFIAPVAKAGCGEELLQKSSYISAQAQSGGFSFIAATPSIVGLWSVKFMSKGKMIDFGYSAWHSDGTEFLNSGTRAPVTQNFCVGVWKQIKPSSYRLNHLALSYDSSGKLNVRVRIQEEVKLSTDGNSYSGTFTIDAYDPTTGKTLLQHVAGTITGQRVTLTTTPAVT